MTPRWKLIFTILMQHRSPEEFAAVEQAAEENYIRNVYRDEPRDAELEEQARRRFRSSRPILHRFNDLVGFAEVYWDRGARIMVDYFFRGDGRTRYGQTIQSWVGGEVSAQRFYAYAPMVEVATVHGDDAETKRRSILRALDHVEATAREILCFVDTSCERVLVQTLDVDTFFV